MRRKSFGHGEDDIEARTEIETLGVRPARCSSEIVREVFARDGTGIALGMQRKPTWD
jgi:hypothetical protein